MVRDRVLMKADESGLIFKVVETERKETDTDLHKTYTNLHSQALTRMIKWRHVIQPMTETADVTSFHFT